MLHKEERSARPDEESEPTNCPSVIGFEQGKYHSAKLGKQATATDVSYQLLSYFVGNTRPAPGSTTTRYGSFFMLTTFVEKVRTKSLDHGSALPGSRFREGCAATTTVSGQDFGGRMRLG
jgi:hypothetical protein